MSRLRRRPLLVGSALLFASLACLPVDSNGVDTGPAISVDSGAVTDTGSPQDSGIPAVDMGQPPAADSGVAPADSGSPPPADSGSPPPADSGPTPDSGVAPTPVAGDPCDYPHEAICDDDNRPLLICTGRQWFQADQQMCSPCDVDQNGKTVSHCAVPGFIGLDQAGRYRGPARSLRSLS